MCRTGRPRPAHFLERGLRLGRGPVLCPLRFCADRHGPGFFRFGAQNRGRDLPHSCPIRLGQGDSRVRSAVGTGHLDAVLWSNMVNMAGLLRRNCEMWRCFSGISRKLNRNNRAVILREMQGNTHCLERLPQKAKQTRRAAFPNPA